jgi:hypothetical protein
VQVDAIKPTLKASGTKRLKLKCEELLSDTAFNFNLRRYSKRARADPAQPWWGPVVLVLATASTT